MNAKRSQAPPTATLTPASSPSLRWFRKEEMEPIWQINLRLLGALTAYNGESPTALPCTFPPDVVAGLLGLGERKRERLARIPCLLVDGGFQNTQQWIDAEKKLHRHVVTGCDRGWSLCAAGNALASATLHLAWYWTRTHPGAAPLILNASPACASVISMLDPLNLNRMAETYCDWFRPRWESQPEVWRSLCALAHEEPPSALFSSDPRGLDILINQLSKELTSKQ